eukprot:c14744_g1_i1.p1 GENE.c14744_g1_i1~~c14744_g1_i1.p1  ORF type:complete len:283 (-),score=42.78 c14744_g1_i1:34-882(-)
MVQRSKKPQSRDIFAKKAIEKPAKPVKHPQPRGRKPAPKPTPTPAAPSSNWRAFLTSKVATSKTSSEPVKPKKDAIPTPKAKTSDNTPKEKKPEVVLPRLSEIIEPSDNTDVTKYLALDCEMVGVGDDGVRSVLASVCIVNYHCQQIYFAYVQSKEKVTDFRSHVSGIYPQHIRRDKALPFEQVQKKVADLLKGRILVGHGLKNDLKALMLTHPPWMIRDTAVYAPLRNHRNRPQKLRTLTKNILKASIQTGEHSPMEDAQAAMLIFKNLKNDWEKSVKVKT